MELSFNQSIIEEYRPNDDSIVYHYCSADTFYKIISNKSLWLCDVKQMNDNEELIYGQNLLWNIMKQCHIPEVRIIEIENYYQAFHNNLITLSACFSESPEILSQWRGYADDARGFCIGFNAKTLASLLPFCPLKVIYEPKEQVKFLKEKLDNLIYHIENKTHNYGIMIGELIFIFAQIKHPSFKEEKEVRFVHNIIINENSTLTDSIKETDKQYNNCLKKIDFRMVNNIPSPYVEANYNLESNPVKEVIIGSKNKSTKSDIQLFLEHNEISGVNVRKYDSSYANT